MLSTVILKPTKFCNADCAYCSAPPDGHGRWSFDTFKRLMDNLAPHLTERAMLLWHGGEPMLMGPDFYWKAYEYASSLKPEIHFAMQTNILLYDSARWRSVFADIMAGAISTSFDPDGKRRTLKGSAEAYNARFWRKLDEVLGDGFEPLVIGTYDEASAPLAMQMYETSLSYGDRAFDLRVNYAYPAGRSAGTGAAITPEAYADTLLGLYERWMADAPGILITPLDQMLRKVLGEEISRCPWTKSCGGRFLSVEPNGDAYNCGEFSDMGEGYRFGNAFTQPVQELLASVPARIIRRRAYSLPTDCQSCRHYHECEGGCSRDSALYGSGVLGKYYYCASWKRVFDRIKESVRTGEAFPLMESIGLGRHIRRNVA
ncbi:radical SAM protein [Thiobacillus denitrificans]|uniref:radical SAM protein n=1 Tax=Thiobacillus denitrificans TaxID=36861 RepID=UPI001B7F9BC8|nr:radical SAM protein [Thiobacillus denitrificans]